ncbi:MAG: RHS repeat-associated core domain-containing protein [Tannerellaceae bacterium]|jgi:RHS repeat-associated protein|nr:RHS repeat-associated core domain-containing protein [Tannerellaceae bacterium]
MGSTVYVSSQAGNLLAYTAYDEWGNVQSQKQLDMNFSGLDRTVNYTGHDYDEILEKYFAQARLYDPSTKRFLSPDPLGQGGNLYIYCKDNPLAFTDPEGLSPVKIREYDRFNFFTCSTCSTLSTASCSKYELSESLYSLIHRYYFHYWSGRIFFKSRMHNRQ